MKGAATPQAYAGQVKDTFLFRGIEETAIAALLTVPGVSVSHYAPESRI